MVADGECKVRFDLPAEIKFRPRLANLWIPLCQWCSCVDKLGSLAVLVRAWKQLSRWSRTERRVVYRPWWRNESSWTQVRGGNSCKPFIKRNKHANRAITVWWIRKIIFAEFIRLRKNVPSHTFLSFPFFSCPSPTWFLRLKLEGLTCITKNWQYWLCSILSDKKNMSKRRSV